MDITAIAPSDGPARTLVTLTMNELPADAADDNTTVFLGGSPLGETTVNVPASNIRVNIGDNPQSGEFLVVVNSPANGQVHAQGPQIFTVARGVGEPDITNITPLIVHLGDSSITGNTITLTGQHLDEIQFIRIGSYSITSIQRGGTTRITFRLPQTVAQGRYRVSGNSRNYGNVNAPRMLTVVGS